MKYKSLPKIFIVILLTETNPVIYSWNKYKLKNILERNLQYVSRALNNVLLNFVIPLSGIYCGDIIWYSTMEDSSANKIVF